VNDLKIKLSQIDEKCYLFYLDMINILKNKIIERSSEENEFDIKAPSKWLKLFESSTNLSRDKFKEFINAFELPNIPYIVQDIKNEGGISYNGCESFNIAKKRSKDQEDYWCNILKMKYGEAITTQHKYKRCIFDFLNISTNTIFECKLSLKDFNENQHKKYIITLDNYKIVYLIDYDCIIDIGTKNIITTNVDKYVLYQNNISKINNPSKFDLLILEFSINHIENIYAFEISPCNLIS